MNWHELRYGSRRVYFIRPIGMEGPVKVGCSRSPDSRREALETWSPFALEVIADIEGGYDVERRFHAYFKDTYQRREWFGWSSLIAETVAAINAGTFDLSTLPDATTMPRHFKRKPWTADQKLRASYSHRCRVTRERTGFSPPIDVQMSHNRSTWRDHLPALDAYLADPAANGEPCTWPKAAQRRAAFLSHDDPQDVAA